MDDPFLKNAVTRGAKQRSISIGRRGSILPNGPGKARHRIPLNFTAAIRRVLERLNASTAKGLLLAFVAGDSVLAQGTVRLGAERDSAGNIRCSSAGPTNRVYLLERSLDLNVWQEHARTHDAFLQYPIGQASSRGTAFFRAAARPKTVDDDWKNQILVSGDRFYSQPGSAGGSESRWVKFTIRLDQPDRVYFQDSAKYLFHYSFAIQRLPGFENLSPDEFDKISLDPAGQRLVLGAVVLPPDSTTREAGIQIVGRRPFAVQQIAAWFHLARSVLVVPAGWTLFYMPTFQQGGLTAEDEAFLARQGITVSSPSRWVRGNECYSPGWAYGRLKFVTASGIAAAFANGTLRYSDILLTDAVPAEIPLLAGTITLTPATPNSHVAILSRSFDVPFVFVADEQDREKLRSWDGQELLLLAERATKGATVQTLNVQGLLTDSQKEKLLRAKQPPPLNLAPFALKGALSLPVRNLTPQDIRFVGGKAANFGVLMRAIRESAPGDAIAFTFDLWSAFLDQVRPDGRMLRAVIAEKLRPFTFPPDVARLTKELADIRALIRTDTDFSPVQKTAILAALGGFDPRRYLRFRSSTNVEDSEQFSGAGLYDSYSGCVADDTDNDSAGPCRCDPAESAERGVFRALRRVYSSFYNDNAFLERLRHGVKEDAVGMAVLVHHSFPDELELANGVATLRGTLTSDRSLASLDGELVTQTGATSVTNPEGNALPEVVVAALTAGSPAKFDVRRRSSLVPLGGAVLGWPAEYDQLLGLFKAAAVEFAKATPARTQFVLDLEYKKIEPGRLVVKQIREVPSALVSANPAPFILNDAGRFVIFQHHGKDLYANHRLKSIWQFQGLAFRDDPGGAGFDYAVDVAYHDGTAIRSASGRIGSFPNASIRVAGRTLEYRWTWAQGPQRGDFLLKAAFGQDLSLARPVPLGDAETVRLSAAYSVPQIRFGLDGKAITVTNETTRLVPIEKITSGRLERSLTFRRGRATIETHYTLAFLKFGVPGIGIFDGKSFPLVSWGGTTISGLTTRPIMLTGPFSQTYDSSRHNFEETFLFEPRLEAGLDPRTLTELEAANIKTIRVSQFTANAGTQPDLRLWGFDDLLRPLN